MTTLDPLAAHKLTGAQQPKAPVSQTFTSSGTWTMPAGAKHVLVECTGAGGGGFGDAQSSGGGGGGGAFRRDVLDATTLTSTVAVTVGAGGSGTIGPGGNGGGSSFGAYLSAPGGTGGQLQDRALGGDISMSASEFGNTMVIISGYYGGGMGGAHYSSPNAFTAGGNSVYGGAGGGTGSTSTTLFAGGTSTYGGNGGQGGTTAGNNGQDGSAPGGGGGGVGYYAGGGHVGGNGARGQVKITTYFA